MNTQLLITFIILNILNVIIQTVKSIVTIKCGKGIAAIVNAVAFGLYTIVTVYLMCELNLYLKAGTVALCNLVGVYVVKWCEEKARKDALWLVKITVPANNFSALYEEITCKDIPCTYYNLQKYYVLDCYCEKQEDTVFVTTLCQKYHGKMFASENKLT